MKNNLWPHFAPYFSNIYSAWKCKLYIAKKVCLNTVKEILLRDIIFHVFKEFLFCFIVHSKTLRKNKTLKSETNKNIILIEIKEHAILVLFLKFEMIKLLTSGLFGILLLLKVLPSHDIDKD